MCYTLQPIGIIHSPYKDKFGTPRQPLLATVPRATLELLAPYNHPSTVRGLAGFSHLWISFIFHRTAHRKWTPLVRPPRLGGNTRVGVFATRSTHRPNPCGLSLVELIEVDVTAGVVLTLAGIDLLDGTPVIDIKPYLPFIEAIPNARGGFAEAPPERFPVRWSSQATQALMALADQPTQDAQSIEDMLAYDPRPAYHNDPRRCYHIRFLRYAIRFRIFERQVEILEISLTCPT